MGCQRFIHNTTMRFGGGWSKGHMSGAVSQLRILTRNPYSGESQCEIYSVLLLRRWKNTFGL